MSTHGGEIRRLLLNSRAVAEALLGLLSARQLPRFTERLEHDLREQHHLGQLQHAGVVTAKTIHGQRSFVPLVPTQRICLCSSRADVAHEQVHRHLMSGLLIAAFDLCHAAIVQFELE